jgi:acyl-CoA reductase-like NAD-dependent aldehyde dehydrogenase
LYVAPAVFADVTDDMAINKDEIFGLFVIVSSFYDDFEALERASKTVFGLGAAFFARDITHAL